jgi:Ca-activated chloride channel family protein
LTGGRYYRVTSARRFKEIYDEIGRMERTLIETRTSAQYEDFYLPFLTAGFLFLLTEFMLRNTLWRTAP